MIKFFRNIRKQHIGESKFSGYFIYALGEIILVVIGILIALQVDNLNERKKNRAFELKMLKEIRDDLVADLDYLHNYTLYRTNVLDSTIDVVLELIEKKHSLHDSLYHNRTMNKLEYGAVLNFNKGSYEALKSAGIDRITNDSLRNQLINHFDFELPFWKEIITEYTDQYEPQLEMLYSLRNKPQVIRSRGKAIIYRRYPKNLFELDGFKLFLWKAKTRTFGTKGAINEFIPKIQETIDLINTELDKQ